jgi:hypothetical protein
MYETLPPTDSATDVAYPFMHAYLLYFICTHSIQQGKRNTFFVKLQRIRGGSPAVAGWGARRQQHARAWPAAEGRDLAASSSW